jgi:DNA repair protein RecN (Recombination protein N)
MLASLRVKNLALVEAADVEFGPGLNVITGETGAGKSVLIGALNLLLGERADRSLIRSGADLCSAEAILHLGDSDAADAMLEAYGLPACEEGQLILRRILRATGASQHFINDSPVTLSVLRALGERLVDMHGPYDHQSLLSPAYQLDLLDAYGHSWPLREDYEKTYREHQSLLEQRAALAGLGNDVSERVDLLSWRVREIEEVKPLPGEEDALREEHRLVGSAHRVLELAGAITQLLSEGDSSASGALASARKTVEELAHLAPEAAAWNEDLKAAATAIRAVSDEAQRLAEKAEADPARLEWLDKRLADYQRLKRKYGGSVEAVLKTLEESRSELELLRSREERLKALDADLERMAGRLRGKGEKLSAARKEAAGRLAQAITAELRDLGFQHGRFTVDLQPSDPSVAGMDAIEFGFAPNIGEPVRPLRAIASSGEISRVMLAIKVVLAAHDRIPVMIFDEIDANVGGEMGTAIGRKLAYAAQHHQVICITHLPQVAVYGSRQLAVRKSVRDGRTFTEVEPLDEAGRIEEIARMLGGRDLTSVSTRHAREMLEAAGALRKPSHG